MSDYEGRRVFLGDRYDLFVKPDGLWQIFDSQEGRVVRDNLGKREALNLFSQWEFGQDWDKVVEEIREGKKVLF